MSTVWISVRECAELLGIQERSVQRRCAAKKLRSKRKDNKYLIDVESLPPQQRRDFLRKMTAMRGPEKKDHATEMDLLASAPEFNRNKAYKYLNLIKQTQGLRGFALKTWITNWNAKNPKERTSYSCLIDARKGYRQMGIKYLLGDYGKAAGRTKVQDNWFEYFKSVYLVEGGPPSKSVWMETYGFAIKHNYGEDIEDFPGERAFMNRLRREIPQDAIYRARYGYQKWNKKYGAFVDRDENSVYAGQVWFSDHRQLDNAVFPDPVPPQARRELKAWLKKNPHKKPVFPWITVWRDMRTSKWLGWDIHVEAPNSDHILNSLAIAISKYGIPEWLYIDNGKDYRAKHFSGGRFNHKLKDNLNEPYIISLTAGLGINVKFSLPYNPQSKSLERDFNTFKNWCDRRIPGFRGGNVVERPEKLEMELKKGKILNFDVFSGLLDFFITDILNEYKSQAKALKGRSRNEAWAEEFPGLEKVNDDALMLFCTRMSSVKMIGRNGYKDVDLDHYYYAEWMSGCKGTKVYIRRHASQYQIAWVFDAERHEFLGKALLQPRKPAMAETDLQREQVQEAIRQKNRDKKIAAEYSKAANAPDFATWAGNLASGAQNKSVDFSDIMPPEPKNGSNTVRYTGMDRVIEQDRQMQQQGKADLSDIVPTSRAKKNKIILFESDLDEEV